MAAESTIYSLVESRNIEGLRSFLSSDNSNINAVNANTGLTPLILAADKGSILMVKILIEYGADINMATSERHLTALMIAIIKGDIALVHFLVQEGANVNIQDTEGKTALWFACYHKKFKIIEYLISEKVKADPLRKDNDGNMPVNILNKEMYYDEGPYNERDRNVVIALNKYTKSFILEKEQKIARNRVQLYAEIRYCERKIQNANIRLARRNEDVKILVNSQKTMLKQEERLIRKWQAQAQIEKEDKRRDEIIQANQEAALKLEQERIAAEAVEAERRAAAELAETERLRQEDEEMEQYRLELQKEEEAAAAAGELKRLKKLRKARIKYQQLERQERLRRMRKAQKRAELIAISRMNPKD